MSLCSSNWSLDTKKVALIKTSIDNHHVKELKANKIYSFTAATDTIDTVADDQKWQELTWQCSQIVGFKTYADAVKSDRWADAIVNCMQSYGLLFQSYTKSCCFFLLCDEPKDRRKGTYKQSDLMFPATTFSLRLLDLSYLKHFAKECPGKEEPLPSAFKHKWKFLKIQEERSIENIEIVTCKPYHITRVTYLEDNKKIKRYYSKFDKAILPDSKCMWRKVITEPCFMGTGRKITLGLGDRVTHKDLVPPDTSNCLYNIRYCLNSETRTCIPKKLQICCRCWVFQKLINLLEIWMYPMKTQYFMIAKQS